MNHSHRFAALFTIILGCHVGCVPHEEDTADVEQPLTFDIDAGTEIPFPVDCPVGVPTVFPIALMTPVMNVDPFHAWTTEVAQFEIVNPNPVAHMLGTLTLDFGELCPLIETVSLLDERGALSDGACVPQTGFTIDEIIPAYGRKRISVWTRTKTGFDASLAALHMKHANPAHGIQPLSLTLSEGMALFDEMRSGPPISVRDLIREDEQECLVLEDEMNDENIMSAQFVTDTYHEIRVAANTIFEVPFTFMRNASEDERFIKMIHIALEGSGVAITAAALIERSQNTLVGEVEVRSDGLWLLITSEMLEQATHFSLILNAPGSRGFIRFVFPEEQMALDANIHPIGCYPSYSETYMILPPEERRTIH